MPSVISPILVFLAAALGAVGMAIALPRRRVNPQPIGAVLCAIAAGAVVVGLSFAAFEQEQLPNVYFYIFAVIALGAALRVITHQRPVYAALYFILTIIASAGLFLILSAEFMAFALIIIYAGAILITYLFVLMLATQAPAEEETDRLAEYDASSREPIVASAVGFLLLAVLTTMLFRGAPTLESAGAIRTDAQLMAELPVRTEERLRDAGALGEDERLQRFDASRGDDARGPLELDDSSESAVFFTEAGSPDGRREVVLPDGIQTTNVERLGFNLLYDHPGAIEIAGIILLMAMLGAVVLSRRQVDLDDAEKARAERRLVTDRPTGAEDSIS